MINQLSILQKTIESFSFDIHVPDFTAVMSETDILNIIQDFDGWIIGDDTVTEKILQKGKSGRLKVLVKWGVGIDNVDFDLCKKYDISISNTPAMFGEEVSDIALNYLLTLTRQTHVINEEVRKGNWYKPSGNSLTHKKVALIGFGDIGRCVAKKCVAFNMDIYISDPGFYLDKQNNIMSSSGTVIESELNDRVTLSTSLSECVNNSDYIIVTCSLNKQTYHMIDKEIILLANKGVILINVARGAIINEVDLVELLEQGYIQSAGLDVFTEEPIKVDHPLLKFKQNIYGSHNSSNTIEAVLKTSKQVLHQMYTSFSI